MPQDIRLWEISDTDKLVEIKPSKLDLEKRIESWLENDISIVSNDLLVIGRQLTTDYGGVIDLLCLDSLGDIVIVELKRDKTPREITAQALDYASWVKDLSNERIREMAADYLTKESLEEAFKNQFDGEEIPEVLNEQHKMIIVASEVDSSSERIITYLSSTYGVSINAVTFNYFTDKNGREYLSRVFLIEPSEVEYKSKTKSSSKRRPNLTYEELEAIATRNGVGNLYMKLIDQIGVFFDQQGTTRSTVAFIGLFDGSRNTIFSLIPGESSQAEGLRFSLYIERLMDYFNVEKDQITQLLPEDTTEEIPYRNAPLTISGYFKDDKEVDIFINGIPDLVK